MNAYHRAVDEACGQMILVPAGKQTPKTSALRLTPALRAELEWLAAEGPPTVARHARIVLGRANGRSIRAVAANVEVHPNTVRNCVRRFETIGLRGLAHASAGKPKNIAFTDAVRDEIARVAMRAPASVGESYPQWSLRRLREHLVRRGVIQAISVEGLRQLLRGLPLPGVFWRRGTRQAPPLSADVQRALESWAQGPRADRSLRAQIVLTSHQGLSETEIAAALHLGRETVRRWLRRFRRAGILGLQSAGLQPSLSPQTRQTIVRTARGDPRRYGVDQTTWSLSSLRGALLRSRTVRTIRLKQLHGILSDAGIDLDQEPAPSFSERSPAVG